MVTNDDPPWEVSGMTMVGLDPQGRLLRFSGLQQQVDDSPATQPPDWSKLFDLAGLDMTKFQPATPMWLPRGDSDARAAWIGAMPDGPPNIRVEAAAWRGRPIYFEVLMPWTRPQRMDEAPVSLGARILGGAESIFTLLIILAAMFVARRNVRAGRGDMTGATRLAVAAVIAQMVGWVLANPHSITAGREVSRLFSQVGEALFSGGVLFVMYLAAEPAMRHYWPDSLLGSTRLLRGRIIDARVGRDLLIGLTAGAVILLVLWAREPIEFALGARYQSFFVGDPGALGGIGYVLALISVHVGFQSVFAAMWCILGIVALKRVLKRMWLVGIVATVLLTAVIGRNLFVDVQGIFWVNALTAALVVGLIVLLAIRTGLLATAAALLATNLYTFMPWTLDTSSWFFPQTALTLGVLAGLAGMAGYAMLSGATESPRRGL
jgi:serine/threonine-protein kinase